MKKLEVLVLVLASMLALVGFGANHNVLNFKDNASMVTSGKCIVNYQGSYTLACWCKLDKVTGWDSRYSTGPIMHQAADVQHMFRFYYDKPADQIVFVRHHNWSPADSDFTRVAAPAAGEWHFLTAVWDHENHKRRVYIDGELAGEDDDVNETAPDAKTIFYIGYMNWGHYFRGALAEMSIWSKALSAAEIASIKNTRPTDFTDCLAYWPLDEGDGGTTTRDISGNGKTLVVGSPTKSVLEETVDFVEFEVGDPRITYEAVVQYPADHVSVVVNGAEMVGDRFVAGSIGTFTATGEGAFLGWSGDVPDGQRMSRTITLTMDATKFLVPVFDYDWTYDAAAKTISDGYWVLNVTANGTELTVSGMNAATFVNVLNQPFMRLLDLGKPIADADAVPYSIVQINSGVFVDNPVLVEVRLPETLKRMIGTWINENGRGPFANCSNLQKVTPFLPASLVELGVCTFANCSCLTGDLVFGVAEGAFFTAGQYHGHQFHNTKIASVTLDQRIEALPIAIFAECKSITRFTARHRPATIGNDAFAKWSKYQCRFEVDANDAGWAKYMSESTNFTAWADLADDIRAKYAAAFPTERRPLGLSLTLPANQWICSVKTPGLTIVIR